MSSQEEVVDEDRSIDAINGAMISAAIHAAAVNDASTSAL